MNYLTNLYMKNIPRSQQTKIIPATPIKGFSWPKDTTLITLDKINGYI